MTPEALKMIGIFLAIGVAGHLLKAAGKRFGFHLLEDVGTRLEGIGGDWAKAVKGKGKAAPKADAQ